MATILSGVSGAFYYKPAATVALFVGVDVVAGSDAINIGRNFNFKPGDPVSFLVRNARDGGAGAGVLPAPLMDATQYYVASYDKSTGLLSVSSGQALTPTVVFVDSGTIAAPNKFEVYYSTFAGVAEISDWSLELSRSEIDVTKIGKALEKHVPFRSYIPGYADANGTANIYITESDLTLSARMTQDVLLYRQIGAAVRLYVDRVESGSVIDDIASRFVDLDVVFTSATFNTNPDDSQTVSVVFRPSASRSVIVNGALLTEDGFFLLWEDGGTILAPVLSETSNFTL